MVRYVVVGCFDVLIVFVDKEVFGVLGFEVDALVIYAVRFGC